MRKKINEADKAYIASNPYKTAEEISVEIDLSLDIVQKFMSKMKNSESKQKIYTLDSVKAQQNDDATKKNQKNTGLNNLDNFIWRGNG